jgi:hypothetical protein
MHSDGLRSSAVVNGSPAPARVARVGCSFCGASADPGPVERPGHLLRMPGAGLSFRL